jgi:hypothetical protein
LTPGDRIAQVCVEALHLGPMGCHVRPQDYRRFVSCGLNPAMTDRTVDIGAIKTSCAVFARAALHWAGRRVTRAGRIGQGIFNGWLEGLSTSHKAWVDAKGQAPPVGAVFYRAYGKHTSGQESHVGVFIRAQAGGLWITAEGGGSLTKEEANALSVAKAKATNGTVCRLSRPKDVYARDGLGRALVGWWDPELLGLGEPSLPSAPAHTWRRGDRGPDVVRLQTVVGAKPDGIFGPLTEHAVREWERGNGLLDDGVWGLDNEEAAK